MRTHALLIGLIVALSTRLVCAQTAADSAREHYRKGTTYYDLQRYREAAREYETAYEALQDPALLYNIAQAYRFDGQYAKALAGYKAFLRRSPETPNRSEIEQRIALLEKTVEQQKQAEQRRAADAAKASDQEARVVDSQSSAPRLVLPTETDRAGGRSKKIAGLTIAGVGVLLVGAGGVMAGLANSAYGEINKPAAGYVFNPGTEGRLATYQALEPTFFAIGGAALVTGIVLYAVGSHQARSTRVAAVEESISIRTAATSAVAR